MVILVLLALMEQLDLRVTLEDRVSRVPEDKLEKLVLMEPLDLLEQEGFRVSLDLLASLAPQEPLDLLGQEDFRALLVPLV